MPPRPLPLEPVNLWALIAYDGPPPQAWLVTDPDPHGARLANDQLLLASGRMATSAKRLAPGKAVAYAATRQGALDWAAQQLGMGDCARLGRATAAAEAKSAVARRRELTIALRQRAVAKVRGMSSLELEDFLAGQ